MDRGGVLKGIGGKKAEGQAGRLWVSDTWQIVWGSTNAQLRPALSLSRRSDVVPAAAGWLPGWPPGKGASSKLGAFFFSAPRGLGAAPAPRTLPETAAVCQRYVDALDKLIACVLWSGPHLISPYAPAFFFSAL